VASSLLIGADKSGFDFFVRGSASTPIATVELHDYHFPAPQHSAYRPRRSFLDLALSGRPGEPAGRFPDAPAAGRRAIGDVMFMPAGIEVEAEWGSGRQSSICLEFISKGDMDGRWSARELATSMDVQNPFVRDALVRLARELQAPGFDSTVMIEALCVQLGIELGRYFRGQAEAAAEPCGSLTPRQLRLVEDRIEVAGPLPSVAEFARECGISARHFFRIFRATTGRTLSEYAADRRIARARARLAEERMPIKQVAWECGFETPAAFSNAFRRATGYRPREYRQLLTS
jgi:AraC family transcriptional regulator